MSHLDARNKRALASGQDAWDNALPPEDDGEREYVDGQVEGLLNGDNADGVAWEDFAISASERIADTDNENIAVKILLNLRNGHTDAAEILCNAHFDALLCNTAESCVRKAMERK